MGIDINELRERTESNRKENVKNVIDAIELALSVYKGTDSFIEWAVKHNIKEDVEVYFRKKGFNTFSYADRLDSTLVTLVISW